MELEIKERIDNLCDYTYNFTWQAGKPEPGDVIPSQTGTRYAYRDLVDELKKGREVRIIGNPGNRLAHSMGVDLKHFGGTGRSEKAGKIYVEGDVFSEMGMGMVSGTIYVSGSVEEPLGNLIEVVSDEKGFRKFRSITEMICKGLEDDVLARNRYDEKKRHLEIDDGVLRGTVAARCDCDALVSVEGDVYNGTGLLMQKGLVVVRGNAGMNTGAHLSGGTVVVEGTSGEFAGAYMKKGTLILKDARGFAGANMRDGVIFAKKKIKTSGHLGELSLSSEDGKMIMRHLGISHVEAMSYHKFGIVKERLVRMRDGSVVVRKVDD